jgi:predicted transcriptional regulator
VCTDKEFVEAVLSEEGKTFTNIVNEARSTLEMSPRTAATYLKRLVEKGLIRSGGGLYWVAVQ